MLLHDSEHEEVYATGGQTQVPIFVTGVIEIDSAEITVLDSDLGSIETQKKLAFTSFDFIFFIDFSIWNVLHVLCC